MLELMYDLPDQDNNGVTYVVEDRHVTGKRPQLSDLTVRREAKESA